MAVDQIQLKTLKDILGSETLHRVKESYIEDSQPKLELLGNAVESLDFATIEQLSHSLKSASSNLALSELARLFANMEAAATQQEPSSLAALYDAVQVTYPEELLELDSLLNAG